jgi:hypothetical protein
MFKNCLADFAHIVGALFCGSARNLGMAYSFGSTIWPLRSYKARRRIAQAIPHIPQKAAQIRTAINGVH